MQDWVALLRGVNVGGNNKVPMADLRGLCTDLGWEDVRTYIASGNVVFRAVSGDLAGDLRGAMVAQMGVDVPILILSGDDMRAALAACPYPADSGKAVHAFFCLGTPALNAEMLAELRVPSEDLQLIDQIVWLYAPDGIGRSKLVEKLGKVVTGATLTGRNLNTVHKLVAMLDA